MEYSNIVMGKMPEPWRNGAHNQVTFCITEDCNLACTYCYYVKKNNKQKMSYKTAQKAVDFVLKNWKTSDYKKGIVFEFIGGEPTLEIELIDSICDYIVTSLYETNHPWFEKYRFMFTTNGILYHTDKVQKFLQKNSGHLSVTISIDGVKEKHNCSRIYPNGKGSYDDVVKNIPLWLEQFGGSPTKSTFSSDDLPMLKDSIIHLWELGIKNVAANVVFEDVWKEGDDLVFEEQLKQLADYILENKLWNEYSVTLLNYTTGLPASWAELKMNVCGTGTMLAIDCEGNIFPCHRFYNFGMNNRKGICLGNIYDGIDYNKLRPFIGLDCITQNSDECNSCNIATGCGHCTAANYDFAEIDTIYQKITYKCKMHKANVKIIDYFWDELTRKLNIISPRQQYMIKNMGPNTRFLYFILSDKASSYCMYNNLPNRHIEMSEFIIQKGLEFCRKNNMIPVFIGEKMNPTYNNSYQICDYVSSNKIVVNPLNIYIIHEDSCPKEYVGNAIYRFNRNSLKSLSKVVSEIINYCSYLDLVISDISYWGSEELHIYREELRSIAKLILSSSNPPIISVLNKIWNINEMVNCNAGVNSFALGPNGKIYICPGFYFDQAESIGSLEENIDSKIKPYLEINKAPICSKCDVLHCKRCVYLNRKLTNEYNTPSEIQCLVSQVEKGVSFETQQILLKHKKNIDFNNVLKESLYVDQIQENIKRKERFRYESFM